jgi:hypothetical protein
MRRKSEKKEQSRVEFAANEGAFVVVDFDPRSDAESLCQGTLRVLAFRFPHAVPFLFLPFIYCRGRICHPFTPALVDSRSYPAMGRRKIAIQPITVRTNPSRSFFAPHLLSHCDFCYSVVVELTPSVIA